MASKSSDVDPAIILGRRIRAARTISGKKVPELARETGWSKEKIYRLEQGRQVPDVLELVELAQILERPVEFFVGFLFDTTSPGGDSAPTLPDSPPPVKARRRSAVPA